VLHRRIAETLRDRFTTVAETQPEIVAHHFLDALSSRSRGAPAASRKKERIADPTKDTSRPHSSLGYLTPEEFAASWRAADEKGKEPATASRPATGRAAAVHGASASRPVAGTPTKGQTENRLNL
jgi:hypothetical protein